MRALCLPLIDVKCFEKSAFPAFLFERKKKYLAARTARADNRAWNPECIGPNISCKLKSFHANKTGTFRRYVDSKAFFNPMAGQWTAGTSIDRDAGASQGWTIDLFYKAHFDFSRPHKDSLSLQIFHWPSQPVFPLRARLLQKQVSQT